ncbi:MAG: hypothetical protein IJ383_00475 [Bacteroidales bacterium]|nr:hypothetical protein [Bacteroidales bacterium]
MKNSLIILFIVLSTNLLGQNITIGDTLSYNGNSYSIALDTLGSQIRQNRQKTYPEYISIQNTGNKYIADNDYFDNPNSFKPSFIDMEGETVHLDINPSNPSEILEAKFFLMWHNNIMLSPNGGNIYRLGKFFHESLSKDLIQFIQEDKNYPKINDLVFRCIIGADGKTKQVQFLIPKDSFNKIMSYIDAEVLYTIEQALKNLLMYDINEGEKKYMQELSLKYFPFKMEYLGYYLEKYQSWYGNQ